MGRILREEDGISVQLQAPSEITISPALLWVIVSVAAIFFICGILHVVLRFVKKKQTHSTASQSNRYSELHHPQSLGRQLQQLFRLQDSGLDQSFIDSLPIFDYKDVSGLKDPFDCAVCLCELSPDDKLRLIPICSHAFHTHCIDTWLLSNSTCPICRVNVMESWSCNHNGASEDVSSDGTASELETRVFCVRLGKLRSLNVGERSNGGEMSRCNLDGKRCFSFEYVVNDVDLQVALFNVKGKMKYESFSVSKVWLWSKKGKFPVSEVGGVSSSNSHSVCNKMKNINP